MAADIGKNTSARPLLAVTVAAGFTGAVVGGTVAMAKNANQVRKGNLQKGQAVKAVLNESAGTGVATASAAAVIGISGLGGSLLGLIGFVGVASGTKYLWDKLTLPEPADAKTPEEVLTSDNAPEILDDNSGTERAEDADVDAGVAVDADVDAGAGVDADTDADTGAEPIKDAGSVKDKAEKRTGPKRETSVSPSSSQKEDKEDDASKK